MSSQKNLISGRKLLVTILDCYEHKWNNLDKIILKETFCNKNSKKKSKIVSIIKEIVKLDYVIKGFQQLEQISQRKN